MTFKHLYLFIGILIGLNACQSPPEFSAIPEISNISVVKSHVSTGDSVSIAFDFKDGDGDLGLNANDVLVPPYFVDNKETEFADNILLSMYKRANRQWVLVDFGDKNLDYNGRFSRFQKGDKLSPIKGTINYFFVIDDYAPYNIAIKKNDTVKFDIFIRDRALNKSNVLSTSPVVLTLNPL